MSYYKGPGEKLLRQLNEMADAKHRPFNTLMLISVSVLPSEKENLDLWREYGDLLESFRQRHDGKVYRLSDTDSAFLIDAAAYGEVGMRADLQVGILRLVKKHIPERFDNLNTSRMIRLIDLGQKIKNAIAIIKRAIDFEQELQKSGAPALQKLTEKDILKVESLSNTYGADTFVKRYVKKQSVALLPPNGAYQPVLEESFVAMERLLKDVLQGVELRGSGNLFNQLTLMLDRILLDGLAGRMDGHRRLAINMNVESVFSHSFDKFLGGLSEAAARNLVLEFRQDNILKNFAEYETACRLIGERGITTTVDAIMPETVGVVNVPLLKAQMAKIFWRPGAEEILSRRTDFIKDQRARGVLFTICRVDDPAAVTFGRGVGINLYQGFHIDDALSETASGASAA